MSFAKYLFCKTMFEVHNFYASKFPSDLAKSIKLAENEKNAQGQAAVLGGYI
jgi:hypothetical protein